MFISLSLSLNWFSSTSLSWYHCTNPSCPLLYSLIFLLSYIISLSLYSLVIFPSSNNILTFFFLCLSLIYFANFYLFLSFLSLVTFLHAYLLQTVCSSFYQLLTPQLVTIHMLFFFLLFYFLPYFKNSKHVILLMSRHKTALIFTPQKITHSLQNEILSRLDGKFKAHHRQ